MLDDKYVTMEIEKVKHIALVAHDGKKRELVDWCDRNKEISKVITLFVQNVKDTIHVSKIQGRNVCGQEINHLLPT
mgnify:CR=1 FL=1